MVCSMPHIFSGPSLFSLPLRQKALLPHDFLGTPADTGMISTVRAFIAFVERRQFHRAFIVTGIAPTGTSPAIPPIAELAAMGFQV